MRSTYFLNVFIFCLFVNISAQACDVKALYSPNGGIQDEIIKEIRNAKDHVYVAAYVFTSQPIVLELEAARIRGIDVKVVIDGKQIKQTNRQLGVLGFPHRFNSRYAIQHSKYVISDNTVTSGSYNFTKSAEVRNSENIVIIKNCPTVVADYENNFQKLWAEAK